MRSSKPRSQLFRRSQRKSVRMHCQAVREKDFTLLGDTILDLSSGGLLLRTTKKIHTGEPVFVSFFEPLQSRWFDLQASVARVVHARRSGDQERCVGLQFDGLSETDRKSLTSALMARPVQPVSSPESRAREYR